MKQIKLTQGRVALVDDRDYDWLNQWNWFYRCRDNSRYVVRNTGKRPNRSRQSMHRFIMKAKKGQQIDHRDGDGLNNQRCNLRFSTQSQNCMNRRKTRGTSRYKGVHWHRLGQKWMAAIKLNYKKMYLGLFNNETEAAKAYDKAAKRLFGEFARLNFPCR